MVEEEASLPSSHSQVEEWEVWAACLAAQSQPKLILRTEKGLQDKKKRLSTEMETKLLK